MTDLFAAAEEAGTFIRPVKPPYRVPTMQEVRAIPWNGLSAVGSFSGCGGSSMGFRYGGWKIPYAIEFIPEAANSYEANSPSTFVDRRDIRLIKGAEILERIGLEAGELDCYEGSPPCSSFSAAGTGSRDWGKTKKYSDSEQRTDDLFFEYCRLVDEMRPRSFVAENVPGMIRGEAKEEYAYRVTKLLGSLGYRVSASVLNAANFGAATERERLIFLGVRVDLPSPASLPLPSTTDPYSIRDALDVVIEDRPGDVPASSMEGKAVARTWHAQKEGRDLGTETDFSLRPCARCGGRLDGHVITKATSEGVIQKATCADGEPAVIDKDYFMAVLPFWDKPCPTITATGSQVGAASVTHPGECRKLTPREAATISGFPEDFILTGTREQRYERIGRAVPPPLYRAVSLHLADLLARGSDG